MRAAQLNSSNVVINFAEVTSFHDCFIDPLNSDIGHTWNGTMFSAPTYDLIGNKAKQIVKIDADVDAIYQAVIGNRSDEYQQAFDDATAYKLAGYTGTVPSSVASWAAAKGWTATQAADDILTAAARLAALRDTIRAARLLRKEQARVAVDSAALATVAAAWSAALTAIRTSAGL